MVKPKIYISDPVSGAVLARLNGVCEAYLWEDTPPGPHHALPEGWTELEGVLGRIGVSARMMDKAPHLRVISTISVGFNQIDIDAATQRGIVVTNTPEVLNDTTADLTLALLLAVARRIALGDRLVRAGGWQTVDAPRAVFGRDIHHTTLGIIGLGRIGQAVARRAAGFDMRIMYYNRSRRADLERQYGYAFADLDTLLAESDFVTVHVPLTPETRHMIGSAQFAKMRPTAYFINAARGAVVDEGALIEALQTGHIAGAGLDVFEAEPTDPRNPLLTMDNVVVMPHVGSATDACREAMANLAVDNLLAILQGKPPLTPVNPEALSKVRR